MKYCIPKHLQNKGLSEEELSDRIELFNQVREEVKEIEGIEEVDNSLTLINEISQENNNQSNIQEATDYIKSLISNQEIELVEGLIDGIGVGSYNTVTDLIQLSTAFEKTLLSSSEISQLIKNKEIEYLDENKLPCKNWTK